MNVSNSSDVLIAIRTHFWADEVRRLTHKLYSETIGFDFVVLVDETRGSIDVSPFEKVSHTADLSDMNLPHWPSTSLNLHYNGDYALYALRKKKPGYKMYFMLESDAVTNIDLRSLLNHCLNEDIALLAKVDQIDDPVVAECFTSIRRWFPHYARVFFPLIGASAYLIDRLYESRLIIKAEEGAEADWPYCEAYVGAFLVSNPEFKYLNIDDIADTRDFTWLNHKHVDDPRVYKKNTIVHPVTGTNFIEKNLMANDVVSIFDYKSTLYSGIKFENPIQFMPVLEKRIKDHKNADLLIRFWNFALAEGWVKVPPAINVAFAKPAIQSSCHAASRFQDVRQDASLLVDGIIEPHSRSHTDFEPQPWVMIDLIYTYEVRNIIIYVRPFSFERFRDFRIETSLDDCEWTTIYRKDDGSIPDSGNMKPIVINFNRGNKARFVRITQENEGWLHLNQVEIYAY